MKTAVVVFLFVVAATAVDLPKNWRKCPKSDPKYTECLNAAVRDAIVSLAGGSKKFKVLPLEPLEVTEIKIGESQGSVSLKQEYHNVKIHGLTKDLTVSNYKIDWEKLIFTSETVNPQVEFLADYKINGKILLLPITGNGKSNVTMFDMKAKHTIHFEKFEKDGETYLRAKEYDIKFTPKRVAMYLANLFNGDKTLGDEMNRFMNENSDLLFTELQRPFEETFGLVFLRLTNAVFNRVPISKIFPA